MSFGRFPILLLFSLMLTALLAGCGGGGGGGTGGGSSSSSSGGDVTVSTTGTSTVPTPTPAPTATPTPVPSPQATPVPTPVPPPPATGRLVAAQGFATTASPADVASADLNGDGKPDLLTGGNGGITTLLNTTTASLFTPVSSVAFSAPQLYATADAPVSIRTGHFRAASTLPDVVSVSAAGTLTVLVNNTTAGAGATALGAGFSGAVPGGANALCVADLNGDGLDDVVVADANDTRITVLLNAGNLTFSSTTLDVGGTPASVAAGDFNADGKIDLAVATPGNVVVVLNSTANGAPAPSFGNTTALALPVPGRWVAAGDLNGDGRADIACVTTSDNVSTFINQTAGGANTAVFGAIRNVNSLNARAVTLADMNGDGRLDLVVDDGGPADARTGGVSYHPNTTSNGSAQAAFSLPVHAVGGFQTAGIAVADFNGDGRNDAAVASTQVGTAVTFLNSGNGFRSAPQITVPTSPWGIALADVNGDGRLDVVVSSEATDSVSVLLGTASGFSAPTTFPAGGTQPRGIAVADVDGDGKPDIAVANGGSNTVTVLRNTTATGAATPSFAAAVSAPVGTGPLAVAIADIDGDGIPDLVAANGAGASITVVRGASSAGTIAFNGSLTAALDSNPTALVAGDFDGDGHPDVACTVDIGRVNVLRSTSAPGAVSFAPLFAIAVLGGPTGLAAGDLNGDGKLDLVECAHGGVTVLVNSSTTGSLSFVPTNIGITVSQADSIAIADMHNDGLADIVLGCAFGETLVLPNLGSASFGAPAVFESGDFTRAAIAVGDVDGDRIPDVVAPNYVESTLGVLKGY